MSFDIFTEDLFFDEERQLLYMPTPPKLAPPFPEKPTISRPQGGLITEADYAKASFLGKTARSNPSFRTTIQKLNAYLQFQDRLEKKEQKTSPQPIHNLSEKATTCLLIHTATDTELDRSIASFCDIDVTNPTISLLKEAIILARPDSRLYVPKKETIQQLLRETITLDETLEKKQAQHIVEIVEIFAKNYSLALETLYQEGILQKASSEIAQILLLFIQGRTETNKALQKYVERLSFLLSLCNRLREAYLSIHTQDTQDQPTQPLSILYSTNSSPLLSIYPNKVKNWNEPKPTLEIQDHRNSPGCTQGDGDGLVDRDVGEGKTNSATCLGITCPYLEKALPVSDSFFSMTAFFVFFIQGTTPLYPYQNELITLCTTYPAFLGLCLDRRKKIEQDFLPFDSSSPLSCALVAAINAYLSSYALTVQAYPFLLPDTTFPIASLRTIELLFNKLLGKTPEAVKAIFAAWCTIIAFSTLFQALVDDPSFTMPNPSPFTKPFLLPNEFFQTLIDTSPIPPFSFTEWTSALFSTEKSETYSTTETIVPQLNIESLLKKILDTRHIGVQGKKEDIHATMMLIDEQLIAVFPEKKELSCRQMFQTAIEQAEKMRSLFSYNERRVL